MFKFPKDFLWGSASSAYQIEGAIAQDGKGVNSWDEFYKENDIGYDGDYAADHYNHFKEDIKLMKEISQKTYRFSVSWSRIFPNNMKEVNEKGLKFYKDLVNELIENNIEPNLTLYHWDMPLYILKEGGWENRKTIEYFGEYCRLLYKVFNGKVMYWSTINEPQSEVIGGFIQGAHPPQVKDYARALEASHIINLSHAKAIEIFRKEKVEGKIGIALNPMPVYAVDNLEENILARDICYDYYTNWYLSPILSGEYPKKMLDYCLKNFAAPTILEGDLDILKSNKVDYCGVNYYMRRVVSAKNLEAKNIEDKFKFERVKNGNYTEWGWEIYPEGLYDLLNRIDQDYGKQTYMILENGMGFRDSVNEDGEIDDDYRIDYIRSHIKIIAKCLKENIDIRGYYVWSTLDLLSWLNGFEKRYGLISINFKNMKRKIKKSGYWYRDFINNPEIEGV